MLSKLEKHDKALQAGKGVFHQFCEDDQMINLLGMG